MLSHAIQRADDTDVVGIVWRVTLAFNNIQEGSEPIRLGQIEILTVVTSLGRDRDLLALSSEQFDDNSSNSRGVKGMDQIRISARCLEQHVADKANVRDDRLFLAAPAVAQKGRSSRVRRVN